MSEDKYEKVNRSKKQIFFNNFIGGFGWAIGVTVGLSLLIALLGFLVTRVNFVPIIGGFVSEIIKFILSKNTSPLSLLPFLFSQYFFV